MRWPTPRNPRALRRKKFDLALNLVQLGQIKEHVADILLVDWLHALEHGHCLFELGLRFNVKLA